MLRVLDREIDILREADAHAVIDLRPRPPDARRHEIFRTLRAETIHELAPADRRLNRLQDRLAADLRTAREVDAVPDLRLMSLPLQTGNMLLRELRDESQIAPLGVDAS